MTADLEALIARRCALRLADLDPNLPALTERALAGGAAPGVPTRYEPATAIALASLLVSVVGTGWRIYRDLKEDRDEKDRPATPTSALVVPPQELLARRVRQQTQLPRGVRETERDRIIEVVVAEILASPQHR